jgi:hypothetical protein
MVRFPVFSFPGPFDGCEMKLRRADQHLRGLEASIQDFIDDHPYSVDVEMYADELGELTFYGRVLREPRDVEIVRWGSMVGDIVHNLRSALDHVVFQITTAAHSEEMPDLAVRKWREIEFPIVTKWTASTRDRFTKALWGVPEQVRKAIEDLQPANRRPDDPARDPLAVLQALWNTDKHRTLHRVEMFVGIVDIEPREAFPGTGYLSFDIIWKADIGPLEDNAPLAKVRPTGQGDIKASSIPHMSMYPRVVFYVAFDKGPSAYGGGMSQTLTELRDQVRTIFTSLRAVPT